MGKNRAMLFKELMLLETGKITERDFAFWVMGFAHCIYPIEKNPKEEEPKRRRTQKITVGEQNDHPNLPSHILHAPTVHCLYCSLRGYFDIFFFGIL